MNPFSQIEGFRTKKELSEDGGKIIAIGGECGSGKTMGMHSLALQYIKSGVNVILFSENYQTGSEFVNYIAENTQKEEGILVLHIMLFSNQNKYFEKVILENLKFLSGKTVVMLDGPMFFCNNKYYELEDGGSLTRKILFEKCIGLKKINIVAKNSNNSFENTKKTMSFLQDISSDYNIPIIITNQHRRDSLDSMPVGVLHHSYLYCTVKKNKTEENNYCITVIKNRFSNKSDVVRCKLEKNNLFFVTI